MAIADYVTLYGQNDDFVRAYLKWSWMSEDAVKIIELYNNMPDKLKKTVKRPNKIELENIKKVLEEKNKSLEDALNANNDFIRIANHQLNTPLSIMKNAYAMVRELTIL